MQIIRAFRSLVVLAAVALAPVVAMAQQGGEGYVLGPEDVVVITVVDQPKFSGEYIVPPSGVINLPVAGDTKVTGLSLHELRAQFAQQLKKRLLQPEVLVVLKAARPQRLYVDGDVRNPGVLELKSGWTVAEALSAAGGLAPGISANDVTMSLQHAGSTERLTKALNEVLDASGDAAIKVSAGDVIRFTATPLTSIYVSGQVKAPGLYKMKASEAGVLEAIAQAGGVLTDANIQSVRVIHFETGLDETVDLVPVYLRGETVKLPRLKAGDMVMIAQTQDRFAVLGYVAKPGYFTIQSGQKYRLSEALALASGTAPDARLSKIGIVRSENGKDVAKVYDYGRFREKADMSMNPEIKPGDVIFVPQNNAVDLRTILSFLSPAALLYRAIGR